MRHTRRLQGLGSHVHVNKAIGFFLFFVLTAQSYHFPTATVATLTCVVKTLTKEFPLPTTRWQGSNYHAEQFCPRRTI